MNNRGFFFSIDALTALLIAVAIVGMIFFYLSEINVGNIKDNNLAEYSKSVLTVIEKQDILSDEANVLYFLNDNTVNSMCFNVTVFDENLVAQYNVLKQNCTFSNEKVSLYRTYLQNRQPYLVKMEAWYQ